MTSRVQEPRVDADADTDARPEQKSDATSADPSGKVAESSPIGLQVTDTWADAADRAGRVEAKRRMPEPDSLGG